MTWKIALQRGKVAFRNGTWRTSEARLSCVLGKCNGFVRTATSCSWIKAEQRERAKWNDHEDALVWLGSIAASSRSETRSRSCLMCTKEQVSRARCRGKCWSFGGRSTFAGTCSTGSGHEAEPSAQSVEIAVETLDLRSLGIRPERLSTRALSSVTVAWACQDLRRQLLPKLEVGGGA